MKAAPIFKLLPAVLCLALVCGVVRGGGVQKIDDTTINGNVLSFDGAIVTIETKDEKNQPIRQAIPLHELLHVRLASGAPAPPATRPAQPAGDESPSLLRRAMRSIGIFRSAAASDASAATPPVPASTQPITLSAVWQVRLHGGDVLSSSLEAWSSDLITIKHRPGDIELKIPTARVTELWHAPPDLLRKARSMNVPAEGEDIAYVLKDGQTVAVKGVALGVEGESLNFRHEGQDRQINLARLLGVVLVPQDASGRAQAEARAFHQVFRLASGDVISGHWLALNEGSVKLKTLWDQTIDIPPGSVSGIDFRNGRVVYLSDLQPSRVEQTPYFDRLMPWRKDRSLSGGPLVLSDGQYVRGVAVHARCVLEYDLEERFERFRTKVGFEQPAGAIGRVAVRVVVDDRTLYDTPDARGHEAPQDLDLDIRGAKKLLLEVDFGAEQDAGDRIIFANARLLRPSVEVGGGR